MDKKLITIVKGLVKAKVKTRANFLHLKRQLSNGQRIAPPLNSDLIRVYQQLLKKKSIKADKNLEKFLRKREIRTLSGVAVITVLTKPYPCPGKCIYCPNEPGMPKSYLSNEPAAARAKGAKFDPSRQVKIRLQALKTNGHETDKVELIVLGGSFSAYPKSYQTQFIKKCFDALNGKTAKTLSQAQKWNETASNRLVGLTLETRPDMINPEEIKRFRNFGCTRVELGVQSIYDKVLKLNQRGHGVKETIEATKLLKQAGFKVMYHLMPNLPGSNLAKDFKMFEEIFKNPSFQPDLLKIYPCIVTKNSVLYRWYKQGKYKPYSKKQLEDLLIKIKKIIPYYVRITRLIRDIPAESIVAGNKITNLRQLIAQDFKGCKCIRCREAGHQKNSELKTRNLKLITQKYGASDGIEYFLSYESHDRKVLYAFLRLRINNDVNNNFIPELKDAAIIRELHTYGQMAPIGLTGEVQHLGLGKKLIAEAERITREQSTLRPFDFTQGRLEFTERRQAQGVAIKKIAVISGIGVRQYYEKLGYKLEGTYVIKNLR